MIDTRSTIANRKHTLLHYLTELLEKEFPDVPAFTKELSQMEPASKGNADNFLTQYQSQL